MLLSDIHIEVRDRACNRVGLIDLTRATFTLMPAYNNVGTWEIELPADSPMVPLLRKEGSGIYARGPQGALLTGRTVSWTAVGSTDSPEASVLFTGVSDDHVLADRLAYPVPSSATMEGQKARANDTRTNPAETLMHAYVNANIGPAAPAARRIPNLVMGSCLNRGKVQTKGPRFDVLGAVLKEISIADHIGFRVEQRGTQLVFTTYRPLDRRAQVRFDVWNNTLASFKATTKGALVTHVIAGGSDEGTERLFVERSSEASIAQQGLWNRRIEKFLDRRAIDDEVALNASIGEVLNRDGIDQSEIQFTPMDDMTMRFQVDWNLGDLVTAVIDGTEIHTHVTQAVIKAGSAGVQVGAFLGAVTVTPDTTYT